MKTKIIVNPLDIGLTGLVFFYGSEHLFLQPVATQWFGFLVLIFTAFGNHLSNFKKL